MGWSSWNAFGTDIDGTRCWGCTVAGGPRPRGQGLPLHQHRRRLVAAAALERRHADHPHRALPVHPASERDAVLPQLHRPAARHGPSRPASTPTSAATAARRPIRPTTPTRPRARCWSARWASTGTRSRTSRSSSRPGASTTSRWTAAACAPLAPTRRRCARASTASSNPRSTWTPSPLRHRGRAAAVPRHPQRPGQSNPDGDFVLSLCVWGAGNVRAWGKDFGNLSRTSDDITPSWSRMLTNFDSAAKRAFYAHPGSWNDPDMLFIGKGEVRCQAPDRSALALLALGHVERAALHRHGHAQGAWSPWSSCWATAS